MNKCRELSDKLKELEERKESLIENTTKTIQESIDRVKSDIDNQYINIAKKNRLEFSELAALIGEIVRMATEISIFSHEEISVGYNPDNKYLTISLDQSSDVIKAMFPEKSIYSNSIYITLVEQNCDAETGSTYVPKTEVAKEYYEKFCEIHKGLVDND